ncbi:hypothetical protein [Streptomyces sp. NPDC059564]
MPGTLADPLEVAGRTERDFLELGAQEWRVPRDDTATHGDEGTEIAS